MSTVDLAAPTAQRLYTQGNHMRSISVLATLGLVGLVGCGPYVAFPGGKVKLSEICDNKTCGVEGQTIRANPENAPLYAEKITDWLGRLYDPSHEDVPVVCSAVGTSDILPTPRLVTTGTRTLNETQRIDFEMKVKQSLDHAVDSATSKTTSELAASPGPAADSATATPSAKMAENASLGLKAKLDHDLHLRQTFSLEVHSVVPDRLAALKTACSSPFALIRSVAIAHVDAVVAEDSLSLLSADLSAEVQAGKIDAGVAAALERNIKEEIAKTVSSVGFVIVFGLYQ